VVWETIFETLNATDSWVNPTVVPERLDKTPRGGGRRQHLSELVDDDQDIHRHRLATGQGDAAIISLCRNSDIESDHSEQDNSSEKCLSATPFVLDPVHGVFGVGRSSSIRMFSSATKHSPLAVSTHFPARQGDM
jgi:hypothetical protein